MWLSQTKLSIEKKISGLNVKDSWPKIKARSGCPCKLRLHVADPRRMQSNLLMNPQPIHHAGTHCMWIVCGAWLGACSAGVHVVDITTVSMTAVPVLKALVRCGGVILTLACCPWLWIRRLLISPVVATTVIPFESSQSMPTVGNTTLMPSCVVGWGQLLLWRQAVLCNVLSWLCIDLIVLPCNLIDSWVVEYVAPKFRIDSPYETTESSLLVAAIPYLYWLAGTGVWLTRVIFAAQNFLKESKVLTILGWMTVRLRGATYTI